MRAIERSILQVSAQFYSTKREQVEKSLSQDNASQVASIVAFSLVRYQSGLSECVNLPSQVRNTHDSEDRSVLRL